MIPVSLRVPQRELERVRRAGPDARRRDARHAVLRVRQQDAVPVQRSLLARESVVDADARRVADRETQRWRWDAAINRHTRAGLAVMGDGNFVNAEMIVNDACLCGGREEKKKKAEEFHDVIWFEGERTLE